MDSSREQSIWRRFEDFVVRSERRSWQLPTIAGGLAAIIAVRNLLEVMVANNPAFPALAAFVHYPLAYVGPFLALTLVLAFWSGVAPARVARLMVQAWTLTLVPPLVDLLLHRGPHRPAIGYLRGDPVDLGWVFVHFFDPTVDLVGTTGGIRIETVLAVLAGGLYVAMRSRSWWRTVGAALSIYVASLFFFCLPVLVVGAFRLVIPATTWDSLFRAQGILIRPMPETSGDSTATLWLVPLVLGLGVLWRALERRAEEGWLGGFPGKSGYRGAPVLLAVLTCAGVFAGVSLHLPVSTTLALAPYDYLAALALPLSIGMLSSLCLRIRGGARPAQLVLAAALIAMMLVALGPHVSLAAAAVLGPVLVLGLRPFTGLAEQLQQCVLLGLAAFSAPAAGYALVIGPEAFARMPATLCVPGLIATLVLAAFAWPRPAVPGWALGGVLGVLVGGAAAWAWSVPAGVAGLLAGLFAGLLGDVADSAISERRGRGWTSLLTGLACLMVVVVGTSRLSPAHEALRERAGCVARLELIRGKEYAQEGRLDLARNAFRRALECEPRYVRAREALGLSFIRERDFERGIEHLEQAREIEPEASTVLSNLGAAYLHAGELDRARRLLDRAVSARPRDPNALYNRAEVYTALGDEPQALAAWKRYLRAAEGRPEEAEHVDRARRRINRLESRLGSPADPS